MELIPEEDVEITDNRNVKKRFLETDSICTVCGTIINSYYEDSCLICECGGQEFISGKIGVSIRLLLRFHIEELRALCEIHGVGSGTRAKMVVGLLRKFERNNKDYDYDNIDEDLLKRVIRRNKRCFWYIKDMEKAMPVRYY